MHGIHGIKTVRIYLLIYYGCKITRLWGMQQCSLVDWHQPSTGTYCLHFQGIILVLFVQNAEAVRSPETSVRSYLSMRCDIPEIVVCD
jgi:hypothetical protein